MRNSRQEKLVLVIGLVSWIAPSTHTLRAHDGHHAVTYEVTPSWKEPYQVPHLRLRIIDDSGEPVPARFSMLVDGKAYVPSKVGPNGLRFVSIHQGKRNIFVATYSRGTGDVTIPLTTGSRGSVTVAKGFEYRTATVPFEIGDGTSRCTVQLNRWIDLDKSGWQAADEHVHYERLDPKYDDDWMTMLEADGLSQAHFLVLRGGNVPGVWAEQYAYGSDGEARLGNRFIRSGEEYRDAAQGHINLLGISAVIEPISTGGIGESTRYNYPPLVDVFRQTHRRGGIGGPAHGGALAKSSTALLDSVLGEVDFFEIANSHLYKTDVWYLLMNCGCIVPPVAGTDLPNFGYRDAWQPLFGEVRTYVHLDEQRGFNGWAVALKRGRVFVTSGPLIHFTAGGMPAGSIIRLPPGGGELAVVAELRSPRTLRSLEVVQLGTPILDRPQRDETDDITTLTIRDIIRIEDSCWLAARGSGGPKEAIEIGLGIEQDEIAHTGAIQVLVGDKPIRSEVAMGTLRQRLIEQQEFYRTQGRFENAEDRLRFIGLFETAIKKLDE